MNAIESLKQSFCQFLMSHFSLTPEQRRDVDFVINTDPQKAQFGDINCTVALQLAKQLHKTPREIAQEIVNNFKHPFIKKIEIAGPGFLNFYLALDIFKVLAQELFDQKDTFFKAEQPTIHYNIEFVSANPTGPLHLGHGRGGIIGDTLTRVLKFLGYQVCAEHYINDAGAQMQKLGNSLKIRCQQELGQSIQLPEDAYHGQYLKDLAAQCVNEYGTTVLEQPDTFFIEYGYQHLLTLLKQTLHEYGIEFDVWFSEKTLHAIKIKEALELLQKNGYLYNADGAVWFRSTYFGDDKDRVLKKADGEYTYAAADAAYLLAKAERGFNHIIIVLGQDHHSYPKRLEGIRKALDLDNVKLECIIYQLVSIKEGDQYLKLSKRAGRIIGLSDVTQTVGKDIARFFYLNRKADAHLDFDMDLALSKTDENPVYYLQYAYVRTKSILEKAQEHPGLEGITADDAQYLTDGEVLMLKKIIELKTLLATIATNHQVHLIAYYLLEVAHIFHNYYHHNRVIEPETVGQSRGRLLLTALVKEQFERCLDLMGVSKPETM